MRGSAKRAAGYLELRTGRDGPLGIVVPRSLGSRPRSPLCALTRGEEEAEERDGAGLGSSTTELQLPAGRA